MGAINLFSKPKIPTYTPPAPQPAVTAEVKTPTVENSQAEIEKAQAAEEERRKTQKGRAATILSGQGTQGVMGGSGVATRALTGG